VPVPPFTGGPAEPPHRMDLDHHPAARTVPARHPRGTLQCAKTFNRSGSVRQSELECCASLPMTATRTSVNGNAPSPRARRAYQRWQDVAGNDIKCCSLRAPNVIEIEGIALDTSRPASCRGATRTRPGS